jgi:hypothetical protein
VLVRVVKVQLQQRQQLRPLLPQRLLGMSMLRCRLTP